MNKKLIKVSNALLLTEFKHIFRVMKLTSLFGVLCVSSAFAVNVNSQSLRVNIHANQKQAKEVIKQIEEQTDYLFVYNHDKVNLNNTVTIQANNETVAEVLNQMFAGTDIIYAMQGNNILLMQKDAVVQQSGKVVTGTIVDPSGMPVIGANVMVKGTTNGTITDMDGKFSLEVEEGATLQISYIGYANQEIKVGNQKTLSIALKEDAEALDELVVVGYGTMKKRDLTGAISSVKGDDILTMTEPSVGKMLQGRAAGLQVSQNSAQPGGGLSFLIRGAGSVNASNAPLIVIDGFPITEFSEPGGGRYDGGGKSSLNSLNPSDIASIEVLKDASSTAIYGARASNGVILISTKKGSGEKVSVEYSGNIGIQQYTDSYDVLDASELMFQANRAKKEIWMRDNGIAPYGTNSEAEVSETNPFIPKYTDDQIKNPPVNTDWLGAITRTGITTQHNVSVSKGGKSTKYLISGNYFNQKGIIKDSGVERFSGRINLDQKINDIISVGLISSASRVNNSNVPLGGSGNEWAGIVRSAIQYSPLVKIQEDDGTYPLNPEMSFMPNPVSLLEITDKSTVENVRAIGSISLTPLEGLFVKFNAGIDRNIGFRTVYLPKSTLYGQNVGGEASINQSNRLDTNFDLTATYNKSFNEKHSLTVMLGGSYQTFSYMWHNAGNKDFLIDDFLWYNLQSGEAPKPSVSSGGGKDVTASYFGRLNYNLLDRYLFTLTFRADGASNFAENKKWGYFPSAAFAWKLINEPFMIHAQNFMSDLKLRISYGQTGNASIGSRALALYGAGNQILWGDAIKIGTYPSQLANPDLTWEKSSELNLGIDFGLYEQRLTGTVEYFNRVTSDLLSTQSLMSYLPVNSINANIGATRSTGWEVSLTSHNIDLSDFNWMTTLTFSRYVDRWKERSPEWRPTIYETTNDYIRPIFSYLSDGLIQEGEVVPHMPGALPGQIKIKDIGGYELNDDGGYATDENGRFINTHQPDGKIDEADMVCLGTTSPGFTIGLNNTLRYKKFDLTVYFYGVFDRTMINPLISEYTENLQNIQNGKNFIAEWVTDMWTHDNQDALYPSLFKNPYGSADYYREKAWFIRCQNISMGYNINNIIRVSANIDNAFVITPYKGVDPETDTYAASYPNARTYSIGLNLKF